MKNNKRGKPALQQSEKRTNKVLVAFNADEYEKLLALMDDKGFDSPAVFLRSSGLRSELSPKQVVSGNLQNFYGVLVASVNMLDKYLSDPAAHENYIPILREQLALQAKYTMKSMTGEQL
ncbi:hypothetical protein N5C93_30940 [Pseudomonas nitroreducens]|uniref:hypothetical protein n=1 Tax=Pseudomonas aeruginosa group TaxID=136841 RepID=UPI0022B6C21F|nr:MULTISPECIES: hypothetical protein [Pseudomonas aeruginosa group]MCZ7719924.1 hypothetical protein [Pseudomonas aeruginosa]MCZ7823872.1 hypothetical protein [Pseudomonas aeruginosa]MDH1077255.1 hypothetical protein [Pseudomonas nitroreducens]